MGNCNTRDKSAVKVSPEQENALLLLFNVRRREQLPPITAETLQGVWRDKMNDGLLSLFLAFLFNTTRVIQLEDLALLYNKMIESSTDEKAHFLLSVLGHPDGVPPRQFQMYISDLIYSYIAILRTKNPEAYNSWTTGDLLEKNDIAVVSQYLMQDVKLEEGNVSPDELGRWLCRCSLINEMTDTILKIAFNMELFEIRPMLPKAMRSSGLLRIPLVLILSHMTRAQTLNWRLLYSSTQEAQSWNIFISKICFQGPTLVLIQDVEGPLFGGFASTSWKVTPTFFGNEECFLFRLRPDLRICTPTGYNKNFQYMNTGTATLPNGLGMGGQLNYFAFFMSSEFGPGYVSKTCTTFRDYLPLASQLDFIFSRIEVWSLGKPDPIPEGERKAGLLNDLDPAAAAIMEMAGKDLYSKNLKEDPKDDEESAWD